MSQMTTCAMIYDFDGTLAKGNCVEYGVLPALGEPHNDFWKEVTKTTKESDGDAILTYLGLLLVKAQKDLSILTPEALEAYGKEITLFPGVEDWFDNINAFAQEIGVKLEHYIVSSGMYHMIKGTSIGKYFTDIFACKYSYVNGKAQWPSVAINYTTKTQYLFRINKGIHNSWDDKSLNKYLEIQDRPIPFHRMIYFGDGDTDIPAMKMIKLQGGHSVAVFGKWKSAQTQVKIEKLIAEERASYVVKADYRVASQLDVTIRGILRLLKRKAG